VLVTVSAYIHFLLIHFVVPLMYKYNENATPAWRRLIRRLEREPWPFVLVGLFFLLMYVVVGAVITALGLVTCCAGFVLLGLPYLGAVLLLPVTTTWRLFDLAWLEQFGPEFAVAPTEAPPVDS
jgi:hypothetical protein